MGLREQAASDAKNILNDTVGGAGWTFYIYDPTAPTVPVPFIGFTNDIAFLLDPDTDDYVGSRQISVAVSLTDIEAANLSALPDAVADESQKPWVVEFDYNKFKVAKSSPDRTLQVLVLDLEVYQ